jgi:ABC-type multidrug transport system fused ATPase/permease subunit
MSQTPAIEIRGLEVGFDGKTVLAGIDLAVAPGERMLITGPSGSGKSTLLHCLLGLAPWSSGLIRIQNRELNAQSVWELRRGLAFVDQEPQLGTGTVREVLHRPFSYAANEDLGENLKRVPELFEALAVRGDLIDSRMDKLSGGEKQRVALISALLLDRPILLLDEATSALDSDNRRRAIELLDSKSDLTILAVAHDSHWRSIADRRLVLPEGGSEPA